MITLLNKNLSRGDLEGALQKLAVSKKFHPSRALEVIKLVEQLAEKKQKLNTDYMALAKEHAVLDEKGDFKLKEDHMGKPRPNTFVAKDSDAWDKAAEEFGLQEFKIFGNKFPISILEGLELTPFEMASLEFLIEEGETDGKEESKETVQES